MMNSSESIKELATALAKAQAVMENASKDKDNPFFKSKYANLESVVGVIRPAIEAFGLSFIQVCHDWDVGAKVETIILHESGEWLSCGVMSAPAMKADAQGFGAALTYARRYSLSAAFGVATEDDDAESQRKRGAKQKASAPKEYKASGAGVKEEAYDKLTDAERIFVDDLAGEVTLNHDNGATAALLVSGITEALDKQTADGKSDRHELKLALWWRLPSNVRTFIDTKEKGIRAGEKRKDDPVRAAA